MDHLEESWEMFMEHQGHAIATEIYTNLRETSHLFDVDDGTHAKWSDEDRLGFLLVFDAEEADGILAAFYAGMDGLNDAQRAFAQWIASLMRMLGECMSNHPDEEI
jgi:hypothetical protein